MPVKSPSASLGRGRPSITQVKALERAILDCALQVFLEDGFAGASMEGIAARANVTKVTVYSRYANKEKLFYAVIDDRIATWSVDGFLPDAQDDLAAILARFATCYLRQGMSDDVHSFSTLILAETNRFPELARRYFEQGYIPVRDQLCGLIGASAEGRERDADDIRFMSEAFLSQLSGWMQLRLLEGKPEEARNASFAIRVASVFAVSISRGDMDTTRPDLQAL